MRKNNQIEKVGNNISEYDDIKLFSCLLISKSTLNNYDKYLKVMKSIGIPLKKDIGTIIKVYGDYLKEFNKRNQN